MDDINLKKEQYEEKLNEIGIGFDEECKLNYEEKPRSNLKSFICLLEDIKKLAEHIESYNTILSGDVEKCKEHGEHMEALDEAHSRSYGG